MKLKCILFLSLVSHFLAAQQSQTARENLSFRAADSKSFEQPNAFPLDFENSLRSSLFAGMPVYQKTIPLNGPGQLKAVLRIQETERFPLSSGHPAAALLSDEFVIQTQVLQERENYIGIVELLPFRNAAEADQMEYLKAFDLEWQFEPQASPAPLPNFTFESVLAKGSWHKISVSKRGLYKIDKNFLEKNLKLDLSSVDPRNIRLYGNGGAPLPESTDADFPDDLVENAVFIKGEADGRFDDGDYLVFFANGPDGRTFDESALDYKYLKNPYPDVAYYFLTISDAPGKRVDVQPDAGAPDYRSSSSFVTLHHENEWVNLLDLDPGGEGSGKAWYGEELSNSREFDFGNTFVFDHTDLSRPGKFSFSFAGRAQVSHQVSVSVEDSQVNLNIPYVIFSSINRFANAVGKTETFQPVSDLVKVKVEFPARSGFTSEGWIDFMQVSVWKNLIWNQKPLYILDPSSAGHAVTEFQILQTSSDKFVWEITDPLQISRLNTVHQNNELRFTAATQDQYREFVVFDENVAFETPVYISTTGNQNLHALKDEHMIILYHKDFKSEAERLQQHRQKHSQLKIASVELSQVYNEFSSGAQDPGAIRNFMRMLYLRNPEFKYLLLFGDGSYDFKHINKKDPDQNFVIAYQTDESLDPITAFPTDDYFGLLDPGEGANLTGRMDINIGRLVARNAEEAKNLVDKIIRYDTDPKGMEDWRMNIVFSSDDEDSNIHFNQSESISETIGDRYPIFNQEKLHLDAFEQVTTPGGERYPEVNKAFANAFYQGALVVNYMGHGGYSGLAQERVLQNTDIRALENYNRLPLVIVASCTFNGFDDPTKTNAGEEGLHNVKGGFLALFSTVRAVYSDDNFDLTRSVYKYLFEKENGSPLSLGEIMRRAKNEHSSGFIRLNSRKFLLFGDPSQKLAIPVLRNEVLSINGRPLSAVADTFRSLETVVVKGQVANDAGDKQVDFNGKLYVTVYDKEITLRTKANDPTSYVTNYKLQRNIIYKGLVNVSQGDWEFQFIVPKDINYAFGAGKMSLYATDEKSRDAAGYEERLVIGGVSNDSIRDDQPPLVKVFLNDDRFISGGICDPNPKIYAQISDDFGINISGNSIGHDLTAILDGNTQAPIILNQVFKSKLNSPKEGDLTYPLKNLSPGRHTLTITAWDIANNPGKGSIEFYVVDPDESRLDRVYNYPNPFRSQTTFQFETNISALRMNIKVEIRTISGQLVRRLEKQIDGPGYRVDAMEWDGTGDGGGDLPSGMYLYQLIVEADTGTETVIKASHHQKLVRIR